LTLFLHHVFLLHCATAISVSCVFWRNVWFDLIRTATGFLFCRVRRGSVRSITWHRCCQTIATSEDWLSTERSNTKTRTSPHQPC